MNSFFFKPKQLWAPGWRVLSLHLLPKRTFLSVFCLFLCCAVMAQKKVSGKVTEKRSNTPMAGVSVMEKGTTNGTRTAEDGTFSLTTKSARPVLVISFVGYQQQELALGARATLDVVLEENASGLNDMVVIGYQNVTRRKTSAAISSVKGKDIENTPYPTFDAMLQGRVAGLNVLSVSGEPGAAGIVNIRGNTSVANSGGTGTATGISAPLYVIDGVVFDVNDLRTAYGNSNPLAAINPNDIESIDVLKDASAAAIYGARAANGVIIVNTKRPKGGKPQFRVSGYAGVSVLPSLKKVTIGAEERRLKMNLLANQGRYDQQQQANQFLTDSLNPAFNNATDWQGLLYRDVAYTKNVDFNVAGMTEGVSYRLSLNRYTEDGIQSGYSIKRTTPRLFLSLKPAKTLEFTTDLYFGFIKEQRGDGTGNSAPYSIQGFPSSFWQVDAATANNYKGKNDKVFDDNRTTSLNGNTRMIWKILPSVSFTSSLSYNFGFARRDYLRDRSIASQNGRSDAILVESNSRRWEIENYATWTRTLGEHNLTLLAGQGAENQVINSTNASALGIPFDAIRVIAGVPNGPNLTASTNYEERSRQSYFTRASYEFKGRYGLDLSFRTDASSRYAPSARWGTFPAISGRWNVSDEDFFQPYKKIISFLKFRASYGITGRDPGSYYAQYRQLSTNMNYSGSQLNVPGSTLGNVISYNGVTAVAPAYTAAAPATNITWEKAPQFNVGMDMNLLRDKITVTVDFYNKASKDLIFTVPVEITTGYTSAMNNYVDLVNKGVELTLTTNNLPDRSKLKWQTTLNVAYNKNFVTKLPAGNKDFTYGPSFRSRILTVGQPLYQFRVFKNEGVYANTSDVPVDPLTGRRLSFGNAPYVAGDPIKKDLNGDYIIDDNDQINMGDPNTKVYGGLNNSFSYGPFSLQILSTFILGRKVWNGYLSDELAAAGNIGGYGTLAGPAADITHLNFWHRPGDQAAWANLLSTNDATTIRSSSFIEDASFFRIKNVYLSYSLPANNFTKKAGIRQIRFYSVMDNVGVFYSAHLPDPENIDVDGSASGSGYPIPKKFTFGIDVQF
jgi:TonB-linked SusC/RagA family outer membrane protein